VLNFDFQKFACMFGDQGTGFGLKSDVTLILCFINGRHMVARRNTTEAYQVACLVRCVYYVEWLTYSGDTCLLGNNECVAVTTNCGLSRERHRQHVHDIFEYDRDVCMLTSIIDYYEYFALTSTIANGPCHRARTLLAVEVDK